MRLVNREPEQIAQPAQCFDHRVVVASKRKH
jgi:hypothetical protein